MADTFASRFARGFRTLSRLIADARSAGLLVILDVKRGDVGSTNDAYAQAYLGAGAPWKPTPSPCTPISGWRRWTPAGGTRAPCR